MNKEDLQVSLDEINGELRMIHEARCQISDPLSEQYQALSREYSNYLKQAQEITKQLIEIEKLESDSINKEEDAKKDRKWKIVDVAVKIGLGIAGIVGTIISQKIATNAHEREIDKGLQFEETGTFTSTTNRGNFGKTPQSRRM